MGTYATKMEIDAPPDRVFEHFVRPELLVRWMIRLSERPGGTVLELEHRGLVDEEAEKHAIGWPHFLDRLGHHAAGRDPGPDPWLALKPAG